MLSVNIPQRCSPQQKPDFAVASLVQLATTRLAQFLAAGNTPSLVLAEIIVEG